MPSRPRTHQPVPAAPARPRLKTAERGYDADWRKYRAAHLAEHPLCVHCEEEGLLVPGEHVDHVVPFKGKDDPLRLDPSNLQTLCAHHHAIKTAKEDGAFGNPRLARTDASPDGGLRSK